MVSEDQSLATLIYIANLQSYNIFIYSNRGVLKMHSKKPVQISEALKHHRVGFILGDKRTAI